jgi:protein gp37
MADKSAIEWTDATVNFWWGCTKVGPGCDHCYAETWDKRTGGSHWGQGVPRRKIASAKALIHRLDNAYSDWAADRECIVGNAKAFGLPVPPMGSRRRVFIQSMSDLFDLEVPLDWFAEAWDLIERCDRIDVQIVTKRVSVVEKRLAAIGRTSWPKHAGLMATVVNQAEVGRDVPRLLALKTKHGIPWVGLSCEPLLGPLDLWLYLDPQRQFRTRLDWVIVGGESGKNARPMHPQWARDLRDQCKAAGVPFFFKQWGEWAPVTGKPSIQEGRASANVTPDVAWPDGSIAWGTFEQHGGLGTALHRAGKKAAGRLLDGVEHSEFPETRR